MKFRWYALRMFIPAISKLMPELSGRNSKFQDFLRFYALAKKAFDEPLPPTRKPGDPRNFKEAFIDEMDRVGDNLASSFHPTRTFLCLVIYKWSRLLHAAGRTENQEHSYAIQERSQGAGKNRQDDRQQNADGQQQTLHGDFGSCTCNGR